MQAWDRYAFVNNNPVRYNDPSGHCIFFCAVVVAAALVIGAILLTGDTPKISGPEPTWSGQAATLGDLMTLGLEHADHATIVGEGLQSLKSDKSVISAHDKIVGDIRKLPEYRQQSFTIPGSYDPKPFTADGESGNWLKAAWDGNQAFYMAHSGYLSANNTNVSLDGTIATTWNASDQFDFYPAWRDDKSFKQNIFYNGYAIPTTIIYHGLLMAPQVPTNAYWNETIPPVEK